MSASSGCVNWKQLLKEIAEELELDIEKESDLVAVAQYYYNRSGNNRARLNEIIKDAFQTGKLPMIIIIYLLAYRFLHIGLLIMTN